MFKRPYHYLAALLVVTLILAGPLKISTATTPAQAPPGYPIPPAGLSYLFWRSDSDPARPFYHVEFYGPNGARWNLEVPTEIINGEEIIQDIQVSFLEIGWSQDIFFSLFPVECEQGAAPTCRDCVTQEVSLCYQAYLAKSGATLAVLLGVLLGCLRIPWYIAGIACMIAAAGVALASICLSIIEYQNCYRDIPRKCNFRFPGCVNATVWGMFIDECLTWSPQ